MSFKKVKVVMLPTNEKANIGTIMKCIKEMPNNEDTKINTLVINKNWKVAETSGNEYWQPHHLYFLSDEEIKVGDWILHNLDKKPIQWNGEETESNPSVYGYKKIIATTDKSLSKTIKSSYVQYGDNVEETRIEFLPQPSTSFIEKFVEEYIKGNQITEVLVEYEEPYSKLVGSMVGSTIGHFTLTEENKYKLKVNPKDNTITIRKAKDSWNKEEFMKFGNWCRIHDSKFPNQVWTIQQLFDKWIEENL